METSPGIWGSVFVRYRTPKQDNLQYSQYAIP